MKITSTLGKRYRHPAPLSEQLLETPTVVSSKWQSVRLPRDEGGRIENETLPRQSNNLRDLEEAITE